MTHRQRDGEILIRSGTEKGPATRRHTQSQAPSHRGRSLERKHDKRDGKVYAPLGVSPGQPVAGSGRDELTAHLGAEESRLQPGWLPPASCAKISKGIRNCL